MKLIWMMNAMGMKTFSVIGMHEWSGLPLLHNVLMCSSVASPICQEGQSERTFPIFALSSRFFLFFPNFPHLFPDFWQFFRCQVALFPPCTPSGYATGNVKCDSACQECLCTELLPISKHAYVFVNIYAHKHFNLHKHIHIQIPLTG